MSLKFHVGPKKINWFDCNEIYSSFVNIDINKELTDVLDVNEKLLGADFFFFFF